ncbi:MAG: outer membrane protein assembly factor BamD [Urechidicola sp.]|jgi:outer membrane protein assembly factor BamD|tara:strand:- start:3025 stop:3831 length:807 start_codon:yes stop_codon:yes gene_type:complete
MKFIKNYFLLIIALLMLVSCSEYEKVLKGDDYVKKYNMAVKLYEKKKFVKAVPLFEESISIFSKLSEKGEKAYYYLCYSHYFMQDYALAGYYFKNFTVTYPTSEHAEECAFMSANCKVQSSPKSSLDQSNTLGAINDLQAFLNRYPTTTRKDTCNFIIGNLRDKLEVKSFESANLYYNMEGYAAASVSFTNMLSDYPDTDMREEVLFLIVKSNYNLAYNSIPSKKVERFEETIKSYTKFVDNFPKSNLISEIEDMYKMSQLELNKIKK